MSDPFPAFEWPARNPEIEQAIDRLLSDGSWGHYEGDASESLRADLQAYLDVPFVRLCSSGTIGVEIALRSVPVEAGDEVILAGYDFPGNFRAVENIGAVPVLVDVAADSHVLDAEAVERAIGSRTRAVIASHLHGQIAPLDALLQLRERHRFALIEDACQVPGGSWNGRRLGTLGDAGVFSFGGSKLLTAGRGGAVVSSDETLFQRMRIYCERGNDAFPMSQLQAAVLIPQLTRLDRDHALRQDNATRLRERLGSIGGWCFPFEHRAARVYYKMPILLDGGLAQRARFLAQLECQGIEIGEGFRGFALRSERRCRKPGPLVHSSAQAERTCLLHHPVLLAESRWIDDLAERLEEAFIRSRNGG